MFKLEFHFDNNKIEGGTLIIILLIVAILVICFLVYQTKPQPCEGYIKTAIKVNLTAVYF